MAKVNTGTDVKGQYKPLSEADIQARTDDASFRKGYDYYLHHAIVEPILSESVLRAFCHGSSGDPYRVEATLLPAGEKSTHQWASAECSCPRGGFCKHLVALLLTWLHQPQCFVVRTRLMGQLSTKSREELLALLEQLMQRQPEIESLVELLIELPLAPPAQEKKRPGKGRERTLDPCAIQSQVALAFYNAGEGWGAAGRIAAELDRLCDIGKSFAEAGQWANAQAVYATVAEETEAQYEGLHDEGQVSWILGQCAAGLVACLNAQSPLPRDERLDAAEREELLTTLFDLWKFGSNYGGIGVDIPAAIAEHATARERKRVEAWLREEMRPGQDFSSAWHNRSIVDFVVALKQAGHGSDEDMLEEYRNAGLYKELTEKFLQLGRANEALDVAQANLTESRDVTWFAEQLLKSGEGWREQALAFVEARLGEIEPALQGKGTSRDFTGSHTVDTYRRWLSEKYRLYSKAKQALDMEHARFQAHPDDGTYRSVRSAAQLPEQSEELWSDLRPRLIQVLEQQGHWGALVSISLDEGEVDQALAALAKMEQQPDTSLYGYGYQSAQGHYQMQVAKAAEERYPDEAIRLYERVVERLIAGRGRENYQQAAGYLTRVKQLYQKQGHQPQWDAYVTNLRNSNKSLRALKEELDKRGL